MQARIRQQSSKQPKWSWFIHWLTKLNHWCHPPSSKILKFSSSIYGKYPLSFWNNASKVAKKAITDLKSAFSGLKVQRMGAGITWTASPRLQPEDFIDLDHIVRNKTMKMEDALFSAWKDDDETKNSPKYHRIKIYFISQSLNILLHIT